jgi:carboxypeptidase family protein
MVMAAGLLSASAAPLPATLSGVVRDARGTPQMGAMVELMAADATVVARVYTNMRGGFLFDQILPGTYQVKATGDSFLPTLRGDIQLRSHGRLIVNLTLSTLFEAIQWLPAQPRSPDDARDDWKWTLRSSSNRPLLRYLEDGPLIVVSGEDDGSAPQLKARVSVSGASGQFGQGGPHHAFAMERSSAVGGHLVLRANLSPRPADGSEYVAGYQLGLGPERQIRNLASIQQMNAVETGSGQGINTFRLRSAETLNLGPDATLELGNEVQSVQGPSAITASLPFLNASWHTDGVSVSYHLATSPALQDAAEMADSNSLVPLFSQEGGRIRIEHGLHQELRFEDNGASRRALIAFYEDELHSPVIGGGGLLAAQDLTEGDALYDPVTQMFRATGPDYTTGGFRAEAARKIGSSSWATISYVDGKALAFEIPDSTMSVREAAQSLTQRRTEAITASLDGHVVRTGTTWRSSYRWQPANTVTPVGLYDHFDNGAYLNLFIRQRVHCGHLLPNGTEALVDVRNLLAQGYRPFLTRDGSTLYFAQDERSIQGGLSFSF